MWLTSALENESGPRQGDVLVLSDLPKMEIPSATTPVGNRDNIFIGVGLRWKA